MLARTQHCIGMRALVCVVTLLLAVKTRGHTAEVVTHMSVASQTYWVEQIAEGLSFPSSMAWLPNGDMLITERMGGLRILHGRSLDPRSVRGTPASFQGLFDGLRDIVIDPDYETNHAIYLLISEGTFDQRHGAVYRARYTDSGLEDVVRIFRTKDDVGGYLGALGRMIFLSDKTLLFAVTGSGQRAQQLDWHTGKVLRINRDGSIPKDNPFLNTPGALPEIFSYGHRGTLGLYQDLETASIWEVEPGPRGGDELNKLRAGSNYGWEKASWGFAYNNKGLEAPLQSGPGIEDPILIWTPSVTPSGITRYRGNVYPLWDGDYFVGYLTPRALGRLRINGSGVVLEEKLLLDLQERIRDVKMGPDNYLYVLTDHQNGRVLRLQSGRPRANQHVAHKLEEIFNWDAWGVPSGGEDEIANLDAADIVKGREAFIERCAACHSMGTAVQGGDIGPDLTNIYGSFIGRRAGFDYSPNMEGTAFSWDFAKLNRFLANPNGFVPGTKMASPPVRDAQVRRCIIGFLKHQSSQ